VKKINQLTDSHLKNLFGFSRDILANMTAVVLPILENERETSLKTRPDRKRKYVKNDGRKRKVYALQKFLMTLLYLRQNVNHTVVGELFGVSADTSENAFHARHSAVTKEFSLAEMGSGEEMAHRRATMESCGSRLFTHRQF
jgi:hypothetical protein